MEAKAIARYVRMSPRKVRHVIDLIRGKDLREATAVLQFTPNIAAATIRKVLDSAAANAENNHAMDREALYVSSAFVDGGPSLRRMRPGSIGRGGVIRRRMSHITIGVSEREELKRRRAETRGKARRGRPEAKSAPAPKAAEAKPAAKPKPAARPKPAAEAKPKPAAKPRPARRAKESEKTE